MSYPSIRALLQAIGRRIANRAFQPLEFHPRNLSVTEQREQQLLP
jgi:hypothetical protein